MADELTQPQEGQTSDVPQVSNRSLSVRRKRLQLPLLIIALGGLLCAFWLLWSKKEALKLLFVDNSEDFPELPSPHQDFDLSNTTIPLNEIIAPGPPKDGIPALSAPKFVSVAEASFLEATDRVIGIRFGDDVRAYPLKILDRHEAVNDRLGDVPLVVTYCPLCDSAAVFDRRTPDGEREFGISGLLYNSNVLLYDRNDKGKESLWSQVMAQGVSGPQIENSLKALPLELTTWADWSRRYPKTRVLSTDTGHQRNYSASPYFQYFQVPHLMFPVKPQSDRLVAKTPVLGVWVKGSYRAYPLPAFEKWTKARKLLAMFPFFEPFSDSPAVRLTDHGVKVEQRLGGLKFTLEWYAEARSLRVLQAEEGLSWMYSFWFAWYALHPETEIVEDLTQ